MFERDNKMPYKKTNIKNTSGVKKKEHTEHSKILKESRRPPHNPPKKGENSGSGTGHN